MENMVYGSLCDQGRNQKFMSGEMFFPFFSILCVPSLPCLSLSPPRSNPSNAAKGSGEALLVPTAEENENCSGRSQPQTHFWSIQSPRNVSGGCKCRPIYVKRNLKIQANVVVSECTVCYRV